MHSGILLIFYLDNFHKSTKILVVSDERSVVSELGRLSKKALHTDFIEDCPLRKWFLLKGVNPRIHHP